MSQGNGRILRVLLGTPITARHAARTIIVGILLVTLACGALMRVLDHDDFPTLGLALWWAIQTVTTVGYGDIVPTDATGKAVAAILMVFGIAFLSVLTASVTAVFVESARSRFGADREAHTAARFDELNERLDRIESRLSER